jgi:hypothetical protein
MLGGPGDAEAVPELLLIEEVRIGSQADPDEGFTRIETITVDASGLVYASEASDRQVRVFDASGRRVRVIGGEGEGPGEFRTLNRVGMRADTLWANDEVGGRITLFGLDGRVLETLSPPPVPIQTLPGINLRLLAWDLREDGLFNSLARWSANSRAVPEDRSLTFNVPYVTLDRAGNVVDTLYVGSMRLSDVMADFVALGGRQLVVPKPPSADPLVLPWSQGLYVVDRPVAAGDAPSSFVVTRMRDMSDTIFRRTFQYSPTKHSAERIESLVRGPAGAYVSAVLRQDGVNADTASARAEAAARIRSALAFPENHPPVSAGRVGDDGVLWLKREEESSASQKWLLVGVDGEAIGTIQVPEEATVRWSSGSVAWASVLDELSIPWLVRYRIEPAAP